MSKINEKFRIEGKSICIKYAIVWQEEQKFEKEENSFMTHLSSI